MSDLYSAAGDISSMALAADGTGIAQASDIIKQDGKLYVLASDGDCSIFYWLDGEQVKVSDPASGTAWGNAIVVR